MRVGVVSARGLALAVGAGGGCLEQKCPNKRHLPNNPHLLQALEGLALGLALAVGAGGGCF